MMGRIARLKRRAGRELSRTNMPAWFFIVGFAATIGANALLYPMMDEVFSERDQRRDIKVQEAREFSSKALAFDVSLLEMLNPMLKGPLGSDDVPEEARITVLNNISAQIGALDIAKTWLSPADVELVERYQTALIELHEAILDVNDFMGLRMVYPELGEVVELREKVVTRMRRAAGLPA